MPQALEFIFRHIDSDPTVRSGELHRFSEIRAVIEQPGSGTVEADVECPFCQRSVPVLVASRAMHSRHRTATLTRGYGSFVLAAILLVAAVMQDSGAVALLIAFCMAGLFAVGTFAFRRVAVEHPIMVDRERAEKEGSPDRLHYIAA
ncbi:hypothetical protein [Salininema proteolyticum]|uniref:Uncharacterized protein n=1 Tax=Salininema proteolyticum TaxID=1607685 RepID=A0ABV8TV88_9ACTN